MINDSKSLKMLDIRLREVGAKLRLKSTSKSEHTNRQTNTHKDKANIGPEGRCFDNLLTIDSNTDSSIK